MDIQTESQELLPSKVNELSEISRNRIAAKTYIDLHHYPFRWLHVILIFFYTNLFCISTFYYHRENRVVWYKRKLSYQNIFSKAKQLVAAPASGVLEWEARSTDGLLHKSSFTGPPTDGTDQAWTDLTRGKNNTFRLHSTANNACDYCDYRYEYTVFSGRNA